MCNLRDDYSHEADILHGVFPSGIKADSVPVGDLPVPQWEKLGGQKVQRLRRAHGPQYEFKRCKHLRDGVEFIGRHGDKLPEPTGAPLILERGNDGFKCAEMSGVEGMESVVLCIPSLQENRNRLRNRKAGLTVERERNELCGRPVEQVPRFICLKQRS